MAQDHPASAVVEQQPPSTSPVDDGEGTKAQIQKTPGILSKIYFASHVYSLRSAMNTALWLRNWREFLYPPESSPNIVKTYESRPNLPIHIFFPASYDQTSPTTLPTLFTVHGGGFCLGHISDNNEWNRAFADEHNVLVIALNYSKAPAAPFPVALHDLETLLLAVLNDESLPIQRNNGSQVLSRTRSPSTLNRIAILGFSSGGNLALGVTQLPSIRAHPNTPTAVLSVYGYLDLSVPPKEKLTNRPWKPSLPAPRGGKSKIDAFASAAPTFDWSYIPYGHDLQDPLLSPGPYAKREMLPPYIGLIAAELDILAHESWRMACRLSNEGQGVHPAYGNAKRVVPDRKSEDPKWRICGREEVAAKSGVLDDSGDERFAFEDSWGTDARGGVKWLLVPDVQHGFDNAEMRRMYGLQEGEAVKDAEAKTEAYRTEVGKWLKETVWRLS